MEASRRRRSDGALRPRMRSPGRPPFGRRETRHPNAGPTPPLPSAKETQTRSDTINPKN